MQIDRRLLLLTLVLFLVLQGCTTTPKIAPAEPLELPAHVRLQIELMLESGEYAAAAQQLESLASERLSPQREWLLLEATEYWLKAGNQTRSLLLIEQLQSFDSDPDFVLKWRMLRTEIAVSEGDIETALNLMEPPPDKDAPLILRQHYHRNMAEIFRLSGNLLESASELDVLDLLLEQDEESRLAIQQLLVQTLASMTDTALSMLQPQPPATLIGWMELAKIIKLQITDATELSTQLATWRDRFPQHPALQPLLAGYLQQQGLSSEDHIAILLPRSGPYAKVAAAVRDGFMAAWYQQPAPQRPTLQFYDSSELKDTLHIYQQALLQGAKMIVGPLNKDAVRMLLGLEHLDNPILALNQVDDVELYHPNLFQFGLAPEDEARQAAERAWLEGHRTALILTPTGRWGERIARSFQQRWSDLGGQVMEQQHYNAKENDFSSPIRMLLNINESEARSHALKKLLGRQLETESRARKDADFIFLAARPQKARQLRPQLRFFHAGNLPILSTSHIYTGVNQADLDRDLGKISFVDTPWLFEEGQGGPLSRNNLEKLMPGVKGRYARLFAMGIDSYNLLTQLQDLQTQPGRTFSGKSGSLYLDQSNRLHRLLAWADMENGSAKISGYAPRMERPGSSGQTFDTPRSSGYLAPPTDGMPPVTDHTLPPPDSRP
ncbi:penicillin-binding protein activator [Candidatus Thiodiazotropha sp. CDECU1]|uniref:penicillin-binding protein activator n=1 Tax=Candidatus Thiodiazotropha sp. CDECU1 TaxID=3065865 RepID=UPI0029315398|nr:penicillin-binding protein activator [Candidatus Thiodiazotropha sp. CDECU1]